MWLSGIVAYVELVVLLLLVLLLLVLLLLVLPSPRQHWPVHPCPAAHHGFGNDHVVVRGCLNPCHNKLSQWSCDISNHHSCI